MDTRLLILLGIFPLINGMCYKTFGRIDKTVSGRLVAVCEFNGLDILDGSTFSTAACNECACNQGHLVCCGYGINGPKVDPPPGCKTIADGCAVLVVRQDDETLDCYTGELITLSNTGPSDPFDPFWDMLGTGVPNINSPDVLFPVGALGTGNGAAGLLGSAGGVPIDMNMLDLFGFQQGGLTDPTMQGTNDIYPPDMLTTLGLAPVLSSTPATILMPGKNNDSIDAVDAEIGNSTDATFAVGVTVPPTFSAGVTVPPTGPPIMLSTPDTSSGTLPGFGANIFDMSMNQLMPGLIGQTPGMTGQQGDILPPGLFMNNRIPMADRVKDTAVGIRDGSRYNTMQPQHSNMLGNQPQDGSMLGNLFLMKFADFI